MKQEKVINFDDLIGQTFKFYGAAEHQFKLNTTVWEAIEDESDGYRSYLGSVERKDSTAIFFRTSLANVILKYDGDHYRLEDAADKHVWLKFGTDNSDDYYPMFVFSYEPKLGESRRVAGKGEAA